MVKIEILLDEIDYDSLAERYLPEVAGQLAHSDNPMLRMLSGGANSPMAKMLIEKMPLSAKDSLAAELINANAASLSREVEQVAHSQGVGGKVKSIKASAE